MYYEVQLSGSGLSFYLNNILPGCVLRKQRATIFYYHFLWASSFYSYGAIYCRECNEVKDSVRRLESHCSNTRYFLSWKSNKATCDFLQKSCEFLVSIIEALRVILTIRHEENNSIFLLTCLVIFFRWMSCQIAITFVCHFAKFSWITGY